ncbi:thioredoxin domain-containing protein PLP3B isoform X1 [Selaginella moellendorffii]|uniref:thioredoxin domain-containing protein PLP3B isoform X1 n=1 Tax=Selaginella moellendorffii TaxID=88036 RepID=UPI000D1CB4C1|nr:thioredoxin domain-containing protein PLP3B isoform X1 [Selaginella moellendorffii]|eukprot:XP_024539705.1 thioredoxin domain-containing protein PLP3B isoform X1 [Selaginella moellendorffii]
MDPSKFGSTLSDLAFGSAMGAAARDYKKEMLAAEKQSTKEAAPEVDLDELMDDPELERLHADRIASLKREAEKRQVLQRQGHGEYREVAEEDFLGEVTGSNKVVCHFYHREFFRCKIINKHLKALALKHFETKFIMVDAEVRFFVPVVQFLDSFIPVQKCPFFVSKLKIKTLPCVILFRNGIASERIVGFEELGGVDDFPTATLEKLLIKKGILIVPEKKVEDDYGQTRIRTTTYEDSDSE